MDDMSLLNTKENKHSIIAISGMPAAGKTTLAKELKNKIPNLIYFDFGAFFRPLTFYLLKERDMDLGEIEKNMGEGKLDELMKEIKLGVRVNEKTCEVSFNNNFFKENQLYNPEMNKLTIDVGTCVGDYLNEFIESIIEKVRKDNPVLLNARRPFKVCKDISNHIFLVADFDKRVERRASQEETTIEEARKRMIIRDKKEKDAGFWITYPFTKIIDTTNISFDKTVNIAINHILGFTIPFNEYKKNEIKDGEER